MITNFEKFMVVQIFSHNTTNHKSLGISISQHINSVITAQCNELIMKFIGIRSYDGKISMIIHIIVHIASFFWFVDVGGGGGEIIQNLIDI